MKNEIHSLDILIGLEDDSIYSINIITDSKRIIWRTLIKDTRDSGTSSIIKTELLEQPKNPYLEFILLHYEKDICKNLLQLYNLLWELPDAFIWDPEDGSWAYKYPITAANLVNWKEYESKVILPLAYRGVSDDSDSDSDTEVDDLLPSATPYRAALGIPPAIPPIKNDDRRISRYNKLEVMGKGAYSTVYLVKDISTDLTYVMKQVRKASSETNTKKIDDELQNIAREIQILKHLAKDIEGAKRPKNSYFPFYVDDMEDDDFIYIITEHIGNYINLDSYMKKYKPSSDEIQHIFYNLIQGLKLLHKYGIIHKDIKPKNIIINPKTLDIQYIDFGLSCWASEIQCINKGRGTPLYIAPEIYYRLYVDKTRKPYSPCTVKKSDIWALGLVFCSMLGYHPFDHIKTQEELTEYLIDIHQHPDSFKWATLGRSNPKTALDPLFKKVIDAMLKPQPSDRESLCYLEKLLK